MLVLCMTSFAYYCSARFPSRRRLGDLSARGVPKSHAPVPLLWRSFPMSITCAADRWSSHQSQTTSSLTQHQGHCKVPPDSHTGWGELRAVNLTSALPWDPSLLPKQTSTSYQRLGNILPWPWPDFSTWMSEDIKMMGQEICQKSRFHTNDSEGRFARPIERLMMIHQAVHQAYMVVCQALDNLSAFAVSDQLQ